jgi:PLP dependent protein
MNNFAEKLQDVNNRIATACGAADRDPESIKLVCVTKKVGTDLIKEAWLAGCRDFGENRIQDAYHKTTELSDLDARWHGIGPVQSNKARRAVKIFDLLHSVASERIAEVISHEAERIDKIQDILIQVNVSGEASKSGFAPSEVEQAMQNLSALPAINIRGLMTMAPFTSEPEEIRPVFRQLRQLRDSLHERWPLLVELSMGMTNDYHVAVEEGATLVRVGTALFS